MKTTYTALIRTIALTIFLINFNNSLLAQGTKQSFNLSDTIVCDSSVVKGTLSNGFTYFIKSNHVPRGVAGLFLIVNAGSVLEDDDQIGLAHFTEHMCFNGTEHFKKNKLISYLQSLGIDFGHDVNAFTGFDETTYMLMPVSTTNKKVFDKALLILHDWAAGVTFDSVEIEKERGVVLEELRLGKGAEQRMQEKYFPVLFKGSKYADRIPIGNEKAIKTFKPAALKRFYKEWYRPDNMAIVVVGDFAPEMVENKIKEVFGDIKMPENYRERKHFPVPDTNKTLIKVVTDKEFPYTVIQIIYKDSVKKIVTWGDYKKKVETNIFTYMLNARLMEDTKAANPPFLYAAVSYQPLVRTKNSFSLTAVVGATGTAVAMNKLLEETNRVKKYGFSTSEFNRIKLSLLHSLENAYKEKDNIRSGDMAIDFKNKFLEDRPYLDFETIYQFNKKIIQEIELSEINALANRWTGDSNRVVIIMAPDKQNIQVPSEETVKQWLDDSENQLISSYVDDTIENVLLMDSIHDTTQLSYLKYFKETNVIEMKLLNGITLVLKITNFQNNEVLFHAFSKGGSSLYNDHDYKSVLIAPQLVAESGLNDMSGVELNKYLSSKNINLNLYVNNLEEGMIGSSSLTDLEALLQLINLYFTKPKFSKEAFQSIVAKQKMITPNYMDNPENYFQFELNRIMTQNNDRAKLFMTESDIDSLNFNIAKQSFKERFGNPGDFTFIFVGNIDSSYSMILKYLGNLPGTPENENFVDRRIRPPVKGSKNILYKGEEDLSKVAIVFAGETKYSFKNDYLLSSLGELLTIRLLEKLREDKSAVYNVECNGRIYQSPYENYRFQIYFSCSPDSVDQLIAATLQEIELIKRKGPAKEEVLKVKESLKLHLVQQLGENRFWLNFLTNCYYNHTLNPDKSLESTINMLNKLKASSFKHTAKTYLRNSAKTEVILLPEKMKKE